MNQVWALADQVFQQLCSGFVAWLVLLGLGALRRGLRSVAGSQDDEVAERSPRLPPENPCSSSTTSNKR